MSHFGKTILSLENDVEAALHIITDGRDVAPNHAKTELPKFLKTLPKQTRIATVCGRFYALDRDNRWERVGAAYEAIVNAKGVKVDAPMDAVEKAHANRAAQTRTDRGLVGGLSIHGERREWDHRNRAGDVTAD